VVGQFGVHRALEESACEVGEQPAGPDDLRLRAGAREQLVDQVIAQALTHFVRQLVRQGRVSVAPAGVSLRSPSRLAPRNAGGTRTLLLNHRFHRHETPFMPTHRIGHSRLEPTDASVRLRGW
jgi:hypothetical protein